MYRYGIENEPIARNAVQERLKIEIKSAGLFIHKSLPYLAASPDGLIGNDSIIEIKCPPSIKEFTPEEAVQNGKLKCMVNCKGKLILKKTDNYYYQVQGQLNITEKKFCYFVVWTPKGTYYNFSIYNLTKIMFKYFIGFVIDKITKDAEFWINKIEPHVSTFYMECLLPEIIDSRFDRGLPIRSSNSYKEV